jgi:hypothetical protein
MGLVTGAFCVAELVSKFQSRKRRGGRKLVSAWVDMLASFVSRFSTVLFLPEEEVDGLWLWLCRCRVTEIGRFAARCASVPLFALIPECIKRIAHGLKQKQSFESVTISGCGRG